MDQVFAPWRIEWVEREGEHGEGCVFCRLPDEGPGSETNVVAANDAAFVLLNNYPYNPGHLMIVPREHTGDYGDLDDETLLGHARLKQRALDALDDAFEPHGYNAGLNLGGSAAGGSIDDHLHTHVVPRWSGDTNFMPVISDTTVIVEALEDSFDRLQAAFASQEGATAADADATVRFD